MEPECTLNCQNRVIKICILLSFALKTTSERIENSFLSKSRFFESYLFNFLVRKISFFCIHKTFYGSLKRFLVFPGSSVGWEIRMGPLHNQNKIDITIQYNKLKPFKKSLMKKQRYNLNWYLEEPKNSYFDFSSDYCRQVNLQDIVRFELNKQT